MKRRVFIFWSIFIAAALFRFVLSFHHHVPDIGECSKQTIFGKGTINREPERKESGQVMIVHARELFVASTSQMKNSKSCANNVYIRMKTDLYPRFFYSDEITFSGKISQPFNFKSDNGRSFDYQGFLAKDNVYYEIKSADVFISSTTEAHTSTSVLSVNSNDVNSLLFTIKRKFVGNLERALGEPHAALAAGLVVGEKSALGKTLLEDFRIVGLIHIVVLSGFNITIVGDAMRRILSFLPRVWGIGVGGVGIMLFGIMVGGGATVVRSCFMAGIALSADLIRRDYNVVRALGFAALVMLMQNPAILLHDPSFQLSFLATLGLILLATPIEKRIQFIPEKYGIRGIVAATTATQIFVSPFILYMMGQISIIGMLVNILVLPIIPLTMLVVFLTGVTGFMWFPLSQFFGWISHLFLSYELFIVELFAKVPHASLDVPIFSKWFVVGFYAVFGVVYVWVAYRKKAAS